METRCFSLLELVHAREFLMTLMNSVNINVKPTKEQLNKARIRLREIDKELLERLAGTKWQEKE